MAYQMRRFKKVPHKEFVWNNSNLYKIGHSFLLNLFSSQRTVRQECSRSFKKHKLFWVLTWAILASKCCCFLINSSSVSLRLLIASSAVKDSLFLLRPLNSFRIIDVICNVLLVEHSRNPCSRNYQNLCLQCLFALYYKQVSRRYGGKQ